MVWNWQHSNLHRFFAGLVEDAFCVQTGVCDPSLTDYIVQLLIDFTHVDRIYKLRDAEGNRLESIVAILHSLKEDHVAHNGPERRDAHRYIGDYTLFWTGVFPEVLRSRRDGVNPDQMVDLIGQGKRSYAIASDLYDDDSIPPRTVFRRLSDDFEFCAHGLGLVRRSWEQKDFAGWCDDGQLLY